MKKIQENQNPSSEDISLWSEITKEIKKTKQPQQIEKKTVVLPEINNSINLQHVYEGNKLSPLEIGSTNDIDRKTAEKFRRGEMKIQKKLDLHGYTENQAYDAVENFIKTAYIEGLRCVLIVTGKGHMHSDSDPWITRGILKERVPQWLNTPQLRPLILSMSYSRPQDGGDGALYVLLRRHRKENK